MFKKIILSVLLGIGLLAGSAQAISTYTSSQVGDGATLGRVLQTDGSASHWVATSTLGISSTPSWGTIIGTLSSQTDLWAELQSKLSTTTAASTYLKLDQTTPQTVINGVPIFNLGITSNLLYGSDTLLRADLGERELYAPRDIGGEIFNLPYVSWDYNGIRVGNTVDATIKQIQMFNSDRSVEIGLGGNTVPTIVFSQPIGEYDTDLPSIDQNAWELIKSDGSTVTFNWNTKTFPLGFTSNDRIVIDKSVTQGGDPDVNSSLQIYDGTPTEFNFAIGMFPNYSNGKSTIVLGNASRDGGIDFYNYRALEGADTYDFIFTSKGAGGSAVERLRIGGNSATSTITFKNSTVKIGDTWTLPNTAGTNGWALVTNGVDAATWAALPAGVSFGTTTQIPYMNAGGTDFLYSSAFLFDGTNLTLPSTGDIRPSADSTSALNIAQADGTDFVRFDTTNKRTHFGDTFTGTGTLNSYVTTASAINAAMTGGYFRITDTGQTITGVLAVPSRTVLSGTVSTNMTIDSASTAAVLSATGVDFTVSNSGTLSGTAVGIMGGTSRGLNGTMVNTMTNTSPSSVAAVSSLGIQLSYTDGSTVNATGARNNVAVTGIDLTGTVSSKATLGTSVVTETGLKLISTQGASATAGTVTRYGIYLSMANSRAVDPAVTTGLWIQSITGATKRGIVLNQDGAGGDIYFGAGQDASINFSGTQLQIQSDLVTATDSLLLRGGSNGILFNSGATQVASLSSAGLLTVTGNTVAGGIAVTGKFQMTAINGAADGSSPGSTYTLVSGAGSSKTTANGVDAAEPSIGTGAGGATTKATGATGGKGGKLTFSTGPGGASTGTSGNVTGGNGGALSFQTGTGGGSIATETAVGRSGDSGGLTFAVTNGTNASRTNSGGNTAGSGGNFQASGGAGGSAWGSTGINTAGNGSLFTFSAGTGAEAGQSTGVGTTNTGGNGGPFTLASGSGGVANSGSVANIGGTGGTFTLVAGLGGVGTGTGATTGANGNFIFKSGTTEIARFDNTAGAVGNFRLTLDNQKIQLGTAQDTAEYYDGTDLIINPQVVGTGNLKLAAGSVNSFVGYQVQGTAGLGTVASPLVITTAQLTALGSQGSMTFIGGILVASTPAN